MVLCSSGPSGSSSPSHIVQPLRTKHFLAGRCGFALPVPFPAPARFPGGRLKLLWSPGFGIQGQDNSGWAGAGWGVGGGLVSFDTLV